MGQLLSLVVSQVLNTDCREVQNENTVGVGIFIDTYKNKYRYFHQCVYPLVLTILPLYDFSNSGHSTIRLLYWR